MNEKFIKKENTEKSVRGFKVIEFEDTHGNKCSLQESSADMEPCIWLGMDTVTPKLFLPDIDKEKQGWIDYPIPKCVQLFGRMHLTQEQVIELLPYLSYFAEYGYLPTYDQKEMYVPYDGNEGEEEGQ